MMGKMYKAFLFSLFTLLSVCIHADIVEINNIDDVRSYVTEPTDLVLFDIDDTLITNSSSIGSPAWRNWAKSKIPATTADFVVFDALTFFMAQKVAYRPVEPSTTLLISDLQSKNVPVFAFTARGRTQWYTTDMEGVDQFTHQQLAHAGIDFNRTSIPAELQNLEPAYFYKGIIFAQHIAKGDLLRHLFKDLNYQPTSIIFVDDKLEQVQSVEATVTEAGIPFKGFWYKRVELDSKSFDPMAANLQLEGLLLKNEILSDEQALELLSSISSQSDSIEYFKSIFEQIDMNQLIPKIDLI